MRFKFPGQTYVDEVNRSPGPGVLSRASRHAVRPPRETERSFDKQESMRFVELPDYPRQSREQGIGKSPGMRMPWRNTWESIIAKAERGTMPPIRVWRELPSRPETQGWSAAYLRYFEQRSRHAWPGGTFKPGAVIERPESAPLTSIAPRFPR